MTCFPLNTQNKLQDFFYENKLSIDVKSNYIIVENSQNQAQKKIQEIIERAGFCPLISSNKINGDFAFTVAPYKIPELFNIDETFFFQPPFSRNVDLSFRKLNEILNQRKNKNTESSKSHYEQNKMNILSLAKDLKGEALILGLGNGVDIPLNKLAKQFDQITVIDVDMLAMKKTIKKLPLHLQRKIQPIQKDLTGMISFISEKIEKLSSDMCDEECLNTVADIINKNILNKQSPTSSKKYNFVVSSMLSSQLFSQIMDYIYTVLQKNHPGIQKKTHLHENLGTAIFNLMIHVCEEHLDNLLEWTNPEGKIYYADTTHAENVDVEIKNLNIKGNQELCYIQKFLNKKRALPIDQINPKINKIFSRLKNDESWFWHTASPLINSKPIPHCVEFGSRMTVVAYFLQPKDKL